MNRVISAQECREALLKGVNIMANAVGSTLGPRGTNVGIVKTTPKGDVWDRTILHDGVSVARSIELEDEAVNFGAQILKQASQKQVDMVGDGTTAVMVLAQSIINKCMALTGTGVNPMALRKGLENSAKLLVQELESMALPVKTEKELKYIATISAQDKELGDMVAETLYKLGKDGVVNPVESKSPHTTVEIQEGMQIERGFLHPWFITNPERAEAIWENAYILVTDKPVTTLNDLSRLLTEFVAMSKMLVIISPDISGEALPLFIQNKLEGKLFTLCIQAPSFGQDQKNILQDIATLTNAKFISEDAGYSLKDVKVDDLGFAEYVRATKDETIFVGGRGSKKDIDTRIEMIKQELENTEGDFDKERIRARLGKLTSGVAVMRIGGTTDIEMKERRERVLDSLAATRAAMDKGIIAGGEIAYLHIRKLLDKSSMTDRILYDALYEPFRKLITNAGLNEIEIALKMHRKGKNIGVDVTDGELKNMLKVGIVDPVLVPIEAIRNAISVSVQIVTTHNIVVPPVKKGD